MPLPARDQLERKLKRLNSALWENRVSGTAVQVWLSKFSAANPAGIDEQHHMLFLLSNFLYFGNREIRELVRAQFQTYVLKPIISRVRQEIRIEGGNPADVDLIDSRVNAALDRVRFIGLGNPSESGPHLLYYYRQENGLRSSQFMNSVELPGWSAAPQHCPPNVDRYIIIDDFCGSSTQADAYAKEVLSKVRAASPNVEISYYPLFATSSGISLVRAMDAYTDAQCVIELDNSFQCFSGVSRIYADMALRQEAEIVAKTYGDLLWSPHPLGYKNGQLAIGFSHNTPDNSLPIFWTDWVPNWHPPFRRYHKQQ